MTHNLKEKCSSAVWEKIIKKHQSFGSETQFPFKHVTDASFLAFGKKKKTNTIKKKISAMHIFCSDKTADLHRPESAEQPHCQGKGNAYI